MTDLMVDPYRFITQSEMKTFMRCRRKWWLSHVRRLRRKKQSSVGSWVEGTWYHAAVAAYYAGGFSQEQAGYVLEGLYQAALEKAPEDAKIIGKQRDLVEAMVEGYFEWLEETGADSRLTVVAAERSHQAELIGTPVPVMLGAKMDLEVEQDGRRGFLDHKRVGDLTRPAKLLPLDIQFLHYNLVMKLQEPEAELLGGWRNMARAVKRTKSAKPPFFAREKVDVTTEQLRSYYARVHGVVRDLLEAQSTLVADPARHLDTAYPNPTRDCDWDCPFLLVCPMLDRDPAQAELVLQWEYELHDPLERYGDVDEGSLT